MIKDILVSLRTGKQESPAEKYAISMAAPLEAQIAGVAFAYHPIELMSQLAIWRPPSPRSSGRARRKPPSIAQRSKIKQVVVP